MATNQSKQNRRVITSFMLRFVRETEAAPELSDLTPAPGPVESPPDAWRGVVKHIQSGAEQHFTSMEEAQSFINKYIQA